MHLALKVFTKFEVDTTIRCLVSIVAADMLRDLWTFDVGQCSYMAGHVFNPSTKFEDPRAIRSRVMSSDISHRIPLTMRLQPLRMRAVSRDLCAGGNFFPHIWNPWLDLPIHYTTFMALRLKQMESSAKTVYDPVLKIKQLSTHAQNHVAVNLLPSSFSATTISR